MYNVVQGTDDIHFINWKFLSEKETCPQFSRAVFLNSVCPMIHQIYTAHHKHVRKNMKNETSILR